MTATREERWFEGDEAPAGVEPRPIALVDLGKVLADGIPAPTFLADGYLYAGQLHFIAGPPDSGKSTIALWCALLELRAGRTVLLLDEESGRESVAEKLRDLGAQPEELARLHYAEFPSRTWDANDLAALTQLVEEVRPDLIIFDSMAAFMARAGLEENDAKDVTTFTNEVMLPLARKHRAAVVYLDHVTKDGNGGRYARGSGAKLASVDVAYTLDLVTPFSRNQSGLVRLTVTKDRRGYLHRRHDVAVLVGEPLRLQFTRADDTARGPADTDLGPGHRKLLSALAAASERSQDPTSTTKAQLTQGETLDLMKELFGHALHRTTASEYLNALVEAGFVDQIDPGNGKRKLWFATDEGLAAAEEDQAKQAGGRVMKLDQWKAEGRPGITAELPIDA